MSHKPIFNRNADLSATSYSRALFRIIAIIIFIPVVISTQAMASVIKGSTNEYEVAYQLYTNGSYSGATISGLTLTEYTNNVLNIYEALTPYVTDITAKKSNNLVDLGIATSSYDTIDKQNKITAVLNDLVSSIDKNIQDIDKLWTIHNLVASNKIYGESTDLSSWSIYGVLENNTGTCMGFTNTAYMMLDMMNIPVIKVLGTNGIENHSWVEVYIDGTWYVYDPTYYVVIGNNVVNKLDILWTSDKIYQQGYRWSQQIAYNIKDIRYANLENSKSEYLKANEIVIGTNTGMNLSGTMTRNELATILARVHSKAAGTTINLNTEFNAPFNDTSEWARPYIQYCYDNNILKGVGQERFAGDRVVTKQELSLAFLRIINIEANLSESLRIAIEANLLSPSRDIGMGGTISHRSDMVDIAYNTLQLLNTKY